MTLVALLLAGLLTALLAAGLARGYRQLLTSPAFPLEKIEVKGLHRLDRKTVLDALGVAKGTNTLSLRMKLLARRVERLTWVESAVVRLEFPATLVVEVTEHRPLAVVQGTLAFLLDDRAVLFAPAVPKDWRGLPVIGGLPPAALKLGRRLPEETADGLRALFAALGIPAVAGGKSTVKNIQWDEKRGFSFRLTDGAPLVVLGRDDFVKKVDRLKKVSAILARRYATAQITEIDLDYGRRAYVRGRFGESLGI